MEGYACSRGWGAVVLVSCTLGVGCATDLNAVRMRQDTGVPRAGAPYNLTFTRYDVTVTRRLAECRKATPAQAGRPAVPGKMVVAMNAEITSSEAPDPMRHYVIDLESLQSGWKITNVEVEYHANGALKSINASAEDRTAEVLTSVVSSVGKIVEAAAAGGGPAEACQASTEQVLADIKSLEAKVKAGTRDVARLTKELETVTLRSAALGNEWTKEQRAAHAALIDSLHDEQVALAANQLALSERLAKITHTAKFTWPNDGTTFAELHRSLVPPLPSELINEWGGVLDEQALQDETSVYARLVLTSPARRIDDCANGCADDGVPGIKYRMPAWGRLDLCSTPTCSAVFAKSEGRISQLGVVYVLPLRSVPFSKKSVVATFDDAGRPTKLGVKSERSTIETAVTNVGGLLDSAIKARNSAVTTELERVQAETSLLEAKAKLEAAKKTLAPPAFADQKEATAAFQADTTVLQAQLAYLQAQKALEEALAAMED